MKLHYFAALLLFLAGGCAMSPPTPSTAGLLAPTVISTPADVDAQFYQALSGCQAVLSNLEVQAGGVKLAGAAIQLLGAAAGSIALPWALAAGVGKAIIAAVGGFAGFTNTAVSTVQNEGLGSATILQARASVQAGMQIALSKYYLARATAGSNVGPAAAALDELKVACVSYLLTAPVAVPVISSPPNPIAVVAPAVVPIK